MFLRVYDSGRDQSLNDVILVATFLVQLELGLLLYVLFKGSNLGMIFQTEPIKYSRNLSEHLYFS